VEGHNFDLRKHLVEYDDVMNKHREVIYSKRKIVLESAENKEKQVELREETLVLIREEVEKIVQMHTLGQHKDWNIKELIENFKAIFGDSFEEKLITDSRTPEAMAKKINDFAIQLFEQREKSLSPDVFPKLLQAIYLRSMDTLWIEHLTVMEELREGIGLRGYGQRDPLVEYKHEAYQMFGRLQGAISNQVIHTIFRVEVQGVPVQTAAVPTNQVQMRGADEQMAAGTFEGDVPAGQPVQPARQASAGVAGGSDSDVKTTVTQKSGGSSANQPTRPSVAKVGRNEPCPCGAKKPDGRPVKYKHCHGR
jgi:preprotein translocase subunit SecA